jgi:Ni,Fe-hydrogenase III large subunit
MALLATHAESEERRREAATGRLFFGYFLLAKQKKVTRFQVREPDLNNRRASDT